MVKNLQKYNFREKRRYIVEKLGLLIVSAQDAMLERSSAFEHPTATKAPSSSNFHSGRPNAIKNIPQQVRLFSSQEELTIFSSNDATQILYTSRRLFALTASQMVEDNRSPGPLPSLFTSSFLTYWISETSESVLQLRSSA
ncbi:DNA ligase [Striga asiatica]|uniref:DNA ligase n=1 Tax=Striga asiatica TaxID=4170 RepID=A0A5A7RFE3_STRAF|nr:DNA ligase [Striga asiatica]